MRRFVAVLGMLGVLIGCGGPGGADRSDVQATSLLGRTLRTPELDASTRATREAQLAEARARLAASPADEETIIWVGRRQAYLGRYHEAIETFTDGLRRHPDSYKLLRHRGHRFITTRQLDRAVEDLEAAARRIEGGVPDEVEPDGMPNAFGRPRSTSHTNIYYHLGLARYLRGEFAAALSAYERCLAHVTNDDMLVATAYWLYLTLQRLGEPGRAAGVLEAITADMEILENDAYHRLLLLYKGELEVDDVLEPGGDGVQSATVLYGLARWHAQHGRPDRARELLEQLATGEAWAAFGAIAAEADLARSGGST